MTRPPNMSLADRVTQLEITVAAIEQFLGQEGTVPALLADSTIVEGAGSAAVVVGTRVPPAEPGLAPFLGGPVPAQETSLPQAPARQTPPDAGPDGPRTTPLPHKPADLPAQAAAGLGADTEISREPVAPWPGMPPAPAAEPPPRAARPPFDVVKVAEYWLNKVAIGLLLFGVAFLFKYSVDQGWLVPPIRVAFGYALGAALLVIGMRLYEDRPQFGQVLLGGAVGTCYITTYGAYELFHLVPYGVAFGTMIGVTALAFVLALRHDAVVLSLIGTIGGLGTPFVLSGGEKNLPGLVMYTCLILGGAAAVYFFRGWHSLIWTAFAGGWAVLFAGTLGLHTGTLAPQLGDRWALGIGAAFAWIAFGALPALRDALWVSNPARWPYPALDPLRALISGPRPRQTDPHAHLLAILTPFLGLGLCATFWLAPKSDWGLLLLGISVLYVAAFRLLHRRDESLAYTYGMVGLGIATLALVALLDGSALLVALAMEMAGLHAVSTRLRDRGLAVAGHLLAVPVLLWLVADLAVQLVLAPAPGSAQAWSDLVAIGLTAGAAIRLRPRALAPLYYGVAHLTFLAWLGEQLWGVAPNGGAVVVAWAGYALLLQFLGSRWAERGAPLPLARQGFALAGLVASAFALLLLATRLVLPGAATGPGIGELWNVLAIGLVFGSSLLAVPPMGLGYRIAGHVAVLAWLGHVLVPLNYGDSAVIAGWAGYGLLIHWLARWQQERPASYLADVLFGVVALWLLERLAFGHRFVAVAGEGFATLGLPGSWPLFNLPALADLVVVGALFASALLVEKRVTGRVYHLAGHAAMLGLLWRETSTLPNGASVSLLVLAAYAGLLILLRDRDAAAPERAWLGHLTLLGIAPLVFSRLLGGQTGALAVANPKALVDLAIIAVAVVVGTQAMRREIARSYRGVTHVALLAWLARELVSLPHGNAYVTAAWTVYALALLVTGLRRSQMLPVYLGAGTLLLVVIKLFVVDLRTVDPLWRSLLFLGCGGAFLVLSYYLQSWIRHRPDPPRPEAPEVVAEPAAL